MNVFSKWFVIISVNLIMDSKEEEENLANKVEWYF